ncbi:MAG: DNA polymerase [Succinivibrionaceae bacterium]
MQIQQRLKNYPVPDFVWDEYHLDQEINDRGIMIDRQLVEQAISIDEQTKKDLMARMQKLTGLDNPNSIMQLKDYLSDNGLETESLGKKDVTALLKTVPENIAEVLSLRLQLAKSSVKKYQAMQNAVCNDGRCHGMFQFYGANRSGRWAGRLIQLQNLPQNHMSDLKQARGLVKAGDYEMLNMLYDSVPNVLSELIRTAFIPHPGYKFIVSDFSAIEARVLSHLAGENWRTEVFSSGGDIYCASASQMFHVPVEKHGVNSHLRQKGKIAELALGYGGSVGALKAMGALDMGLAEDELQPLVNMWRNSNPNIVSFWWQIDSAVKTAIQMCTSERIGNISFTVKSGMLFITLPSGRKLAYVKPRIGMNQFGGESVTYMGIDATKKWSRIESYGPKFVENIVQAISRDILAYAMQTLKHCFIVGHVHDELIIECSEKVSLEKICEQMGRTPEWIQGLVLRADGYECGFYKKD